jgi:hypothetical protein
MNAKCSSIWDPDAPADTAVEVYMGTNRNRVYWNISRQLTLCDSNDWKTYSYLGDWNSVPLNRSGKYGN